MDVKREIKILDDKIHTQVRRQELYSKKFHEAERKIEKFLEKGGPLFKREKRKRLEQDRGQYLREIRAAEDEELRLIAERSKLVD